MAVKEARRESVLDLWSRGWHTCLSMRRREHEIPLCLARRTGNTQDDDEAFKTAIGSNMEMQTDAAGAILLELNDLGKMMSIKCKHQENLGRNCGR